MASNRGKTNANQQVVNISLNGLDLEKMMPKEKSEKKRRGGLAAELKRAAKQHQTAKDNAEKRGVQVLSIWRHPPNICSTPRLPHKYKHCQITWPTVQ